jgi:hypothetical protein
MSEVTDWIVQFADDFAAPMLVSAATGPDAARAIHDRLTESSIIGDFEVRLAVDQETLEPDGRGVVTRCTGDRPRLARFRMRVANRRAA